jgi:hypothetical protein
MLEVDTRFPTEQLPGPADVRLAAAWVIERQWKLSDRDREPVSAVTFKLNHAHSIGVADVDRNIDGVLVHHQLA